MGNVYAIELCQSGIVIKDDLNVYFFICLIQLEFRFEFPILCSVLCAVSRAPNYAILDSKYFRLVFAAI